MPSLLIPGDLLVVNDTRVTARRLFGQRPSGGKVELLLLSQGAPLSFECMAKPGRRLPVGAQVEFGEGYPRAKVEKVLDEGLRQITFDDDPTALLQEAGRVPLPPYIHHTLADPERYQTVYAAHGGSAAAPTAGLHFTPEVMGELNRKGIDIAHVTLDVGIDTFRPVMAEDLSKHRMHGERCSIPEDSAARINACQGRIIAVGTTSARTLESFAQGTRQVGAGSKVTDIFIRPGFSFRIIDGMFTNFHMPRTTMLMMLSALVGRDAVFNAYREALANGYRFLSFGDSMLIL